jgi:hypothetical protein
MIYVGFWTDKGKADTDTLDFLQQLHQLRGHDPDREDQMSSRYHAEGRALGDQELQNPTGGTA